MKRLSASFVESFAKLDSVLGKPFYASDIGLNGGQVSALCFNHQILGWTGRVKEYTIAHPDNDKLLIKCFAKEWVVRKRKYDLLRASICYEVAEMRRIVSICEELGY